MAYFLDAAQMSVSGTPGAGTITLGSAVPGYTTFAAAGILNGQLISYAIQDTGGNYEFGRGTYTSSGTTLARTTILGSSNGGAAVVLTSAAIVSATLLAQDIVVPRGNISGLTLSNDVSTPNTVLDIATGNVCSSDGTTMMSLLSAFTKTTAAWVVGTGNGGLDTGSVAINTWYHVYLIAGLPTLAPDILFSTSATTPTLPGGYTYKQVIGSFRTDGSAHIIPFSQNGDEFLWLVPVADFSGAIGSTTNSNVVLSVPLGRKTNALLSANYANANAPPTYLYVSSMDTTAQTAGAAASTAVTQVINVPVGFGIASVRTDLLSQVRVACNAASGTLNLITLGWIDTRGRFA